MACKKTTHEYYSSEKIVSNPELPPCSSNLKPCDSYLSLHLKCELKEHRFKHASEAGETSSQTVRILAF